jgi:hypothetical protein
MLSAARYLLVGVLAAACGDSTSSGGAPAGGGGQGGGGGGGGGGEGPVTGVEFTCGAETCNSLLAYCYYSEDAPDADGNQTIFEGCVDLPQACLDDVSCECLEAAGTPFECCEGDGATGIRAESPHGGCL